MARKRLAFGAEPMPNVDGVFCHASLLVLDGHLVSSPEYAGRAPSCNDDKSAGIDGCEFISLEPALVCTSECLEDMALTARP
jgi:hypothetical protein